MRSREIIKSTRLTLLLLIAMTVAAGCAIFSASSLTPAQQTLWALKVYEAQYNWYLDQMINPSLGAEMRQTLKTDPTLIVGDRINPDLTDTQKEILRVKQAILVELKPIVLSVAELNQTGQLPTEEIQKQLTRLINELLMSGE